MNLVFHFFLFLQEYDKEVKGFVYCLEGSSQTVKMQTPDSSKVSRKLPSILEPIRKLFQILLTHDCGSMFCCSHAPPPAVGLLHSFVVLQVNIPRSKDFSIEIM